MMRLVSSLLAACLVLLSTYGTFAKADPASAELYMGGKWFFAHSPKPYASNSLGLHFLTCTCLRDYVCSSTQDSVAGIAIDTVKGSPVLLDSGAYMTCVVEGNGGVYSPNCSPKFSLVANCIDSLT
ncbi:uncharacterized protein L969DRAFT_15667 [Mixia osmundae IAM 14324]|uniref:Peptidase A1 domain-containing protein n=1 Tax=Mixia osmundae (strain CBS 9802 / IAM 14324 / JCM 22182 / KY 12970) TaxID=764103 RepID=G7DYT7_MIXOS|nr:uncharacterized protein L969DRAFT_15667 [Mixia osmundae IAM 14324]KEI41643.1 hypothetical protein L969DRAFT_15667 [Mixia osmundae IAM 14324]GAA95747.1 hypothetical protein E5Q_02404 [Mixia osmundae IAM 14324]